MPKKLYAVVADSTGTVEYSSHSAEACQDMYYRIPSSFRSAFSIWEFLPCGSFDQVHLNEKHRKGKFTHDNKR